MVIYVALVKVCWHSDICGGTSDVGVVVQRLQVNGDVSMGCVNDESAVGDFAKGHISRFREWNGKLTYTLKMLNFYITTLFYAVKEGAWVRLYQFLESWLQNRKCVT